MFYIIYDAKIQLKSKKINRYITTKPIHYTLGEKIFKTYEAPKNADDSCLTAEDDKPKNLGFWYVDLLILD